MTQKHLKPTVESIPDVFVQRLSKELPMAVCERVLSGFSCERHTTFRANALLVRESDPFAALDSEGIPVSRIQLPGSAGKAARVTCDFRERLLQSAEYSSKRIYVQNLASMLPPLLLGVEPGHRVLDLAAAPGSKTLQLAEAAGEEAEIAAVEIVRSRFFRLKANLAAHGAGFVRLFLQDGTRVWRYRPEHFDRVLLDAPCASEGRFQTAVPESLAYWTPRKNREMARKQKALLYSAIQSTRPGGLIVYSTCSLSVEENEAIISRALSRFGAALRTVPIELPYDEAVAPVMEWKGKQLHAGVELARRIVPSELMEGFFLCLLKKTASTAG